MKRKYGNRAGWKRVTKRQYAQAYVEDSSFTGYVSLIKLVEVDGVLFANYKDKSVCIANNGFIWMQHFPKDKHFSLTTMYDEKGNVVQWYIDICLENGVDDQNIPWMDDLFLDIIVLPNGEIILKDENELNEAFHNGTISEASYNLAKEEAQAIHQLILQNRFTLFEQAHIHKLSLLQQLSDIY